MAPRKNGIVLLVGAALLLVVLLLAGGFPYEAIVATLWSPVTLRMLVRRTKVSRTSLAVLVSSGLLCLAGIYAVAHHRIVVTNSAGEPVHYLFINVPLGRYVSGDQDWNGSVAKMSSGRTVKSGYFDLLNPGYIRVAGQLADGTQFDVNGKVEHRLTILGGYTQIVIQPGGDIEFKQH